MAVAVAVNLREQSHRSIARSRECLLTSSAVIVRAEELLRSAPVVDLNLAREMRCLISDLRRNNNEIREGISQLMAVWDEYEIWRGSVSYLPRHSD
jgi:hypothetical protein